MSAKRIFRGAAGLSFVMMLGAVTAYLHYERFSEGEHASGVVRPGITPRVCIGWFEEEPPFSSIIHDCPPHFAVFGTSNGSRAPSREAAAISFSAYCCPLPSEDILLDEHRFTTGTACDEGWVATGGTGNLCGENCVMRCTKVNSERYKLGPPRQSLFFRDTGTFRAMGAYGGGLARQIAWSSIPAALRSGLGRGSPDSWSGDGCVGAPFGALLTERRSSLCDGYYYRELQYSDGVPVKMFPDCAALDSVNIPNPTCLQEPGG